MIRPFAVSDREAPALNRRMVDVSDEIRRCYLRCWSLDGEFLVKYRMVCEKMMKMQEDLAAFEPQVRPRYMDLFKFHKAEIEKNLNGVMEVYRTVKNLMAEGAELADKYGSDIGTARQIAGMYERAYNRLPQADGPMSVAEKLHEGITMFVFLQKMEH